LPNVTTEYPGPNTSPLWHRATALAVASSACFASVASKGSAGEVNGTGGGVSATGGPEDASGGVSATGGPEDANGGSKAVAVADAMAVAVVAVGRVSVATEWLPER
jgi:hypothetical protein